MSNILKIAGAGVSAAAEETDEYFNQTVLLLHGDGSEGDHNNTFLDSSSSPKTIVRNPTTGPNAPTQGTFSPFSVGAGEWSVSFPGSSYLTVPDNAVFEMSGDFTVEAYFYLNEIPASTKFADIVTKGASGVYQPYYIFVNSSAQLLFYSSSNGTSWDVASAKVFGTVSAGQWYHVAVSRSGSSLRMFLNGALIDTIINSDSLTNNTRAVGIGGRSDGTEDDINGYISNVRIVKGRAVYTSAFTPETTPLGATSGGQNPPQGTETSLLTCQSNRFVDNGGLATPNTITVNGSPKVTPFSPFAPTAAYDASVNGGSSYHDASNLSLAQALVGSTTSTFTAEGWVYMTATPSNGNNSIHGGLFHLDGEPSTGTLYLSFGPNRDQQLSMGWFDGAAKQAYVNETLPLNTWIHIATSVSSNTIKMFINGEEKTVSGTTTLTNRSGTTNKSTIGGSTSFQTLMYGYIADARVSSIARYSASFSVPTAPLTSDANTTVLSLATNAGIFDNTGKNNLETVADTQIDTAIKKYGTGSIQFDGTGDQLYIANSPELALGTGDFTVEMWYYENSGVSGNKGLFDTRTVAGATNGFLLQRIDTKNLRVFTDASVVTTGTNTIVQETWQHIAVVRQSGTIRIYLDGVQKASAANTQNFTNTDCWIGDNADESQKLNGYLDDIRVTKGICRYPDGTTFTPPTKAFPDL